MSQFTDQLRDLAGFIERNDLPAPIRLSAASNGLNEIQVSERDRASWFNTISHPVTIAEGFNPGTKRGMTYLVLGQVPQKVAVISIWEQDCADPKCPHHGSKVETPRLCEPRGTRYVEQDHGTTQSGAGWSE